MSVKSLDVLVIIPAFDRTLPHVDEEILQQIAQVIVGGRLVVNRTKVSESSPVLALLDKNRREVVAVDGSLGRETSGFFHRGDGFVEKAVRGKAQAKMV